MSAILNRITGMTSPELHRLNGYIPVVSEGLGCVVAVSGTFFVALGLMEGLNAPKRSIQKHYQHEFAGAGCNMIIGGLKRAIFTETVGVCLALYVYNRVSK